MKVQIVMNVDLQELDTCELDGVKINDDNLGEVIGDFYVAEALARVIREKLEEEEDSGNGDTEYYLV